MTTEIKQPDTTQAGTQPAAQPQAKPEVKPQGQPQAQPQGQPQATPDVATLQAELKAKDEALKKASFEVQNAYQLGQQEALRRSQQPQQPQEPQLDENDPLGIKRTVSEVIQQDRLVLNYESSFNNYANELQKNWHPEIPGVNKEALDKATSQHAYQLADNPNFLPHLINNPQERVAQAFNVAMAQSPVKYVQVVTGAQPTAPNISSSSNGQTDYNGQIAPSGSTADVIGSLQAQLKDAQAKAIANPTVESRQLVSELSFKLQDAQRKK